MQSATIIEKYQNFMSSLTTQGAIMVFTVILALIFILWEIVLWLPLQNKKDRTEQRITEYTATIADSTTKLATLKKRQAAQTSIGIVSTIDPKQVPEILKKLLTYQYNLRLISLDSIPQVIKKDKDTEKDSIPQLMQQKISLSFTGDFFNILSYLETLEKQNLPVYWDQFNYKITKYPFGEVNLELHTVSHYESPE